MTRSLELDDINSPQVPSEPASSAGGRHVVYVLRPTDVREDAGRYGRGSRRRRRRRGAQRPASYGEVAVVDLTGGALTRHTAASLPDLKLLRPEPRTFTVHGGAEVHVWLLRDPAAPIPAPLLSDFRPDQHVGHQRRRTFPGGQEWPDPSTHPQQLAELSPWSKVSAVTTPTLLLQGLADDRCPPGRPSSGSPRCAAAASRPK